MRAGELRHQIVIQQATAAQSSSGETSDSWSTFATVRAAIEPLSAREFFQLDQDAAERTIRFVIRYLAGVTPKMRISWDSRVFDIQSVLNTKQRDRSLNIIAIERDV